MSDYSFLRDFSQRPTHTELFSRSVKILEIPEYREYCLSGFMASIGGLTESLVKSSSEGLESYLTTLPEYSTESLSLLDCFDSMLNIFEANRKNDRVSIAVMSAIENFISCGLLEKLQAMTEEMEEITDRIFTRLVALVKNELLKSKETKKLTLGIKM